MCPTNQILIAIIVALLIMNYMKPKEKEKYCPNCGNNVKVSI
jgi:hypothetical protein